MTNRTIMILLVRLVATIFFLNFPLSSIQAADVKLTIGDGSGFTGSDNNLIEIYLDNSYDSVKGVQVDIADEGDNLTCLECAADAVRAPQFNCSVQEQSSGECRVMLFTFNPIVPIPRGTGPIFTLEYSVDEVSPAGECKNLDPERVAVSDENNQPLDVELVSGEFCLLNCIVDSDCDDGNGCSSDTCSNGQCVHECNAFSPFDFCCDNPACISDLMCTNAYDTDYDGIPDDEDNCPDIPNNSQVNIDGDSHGDACDNCPYNDNENQEDTDGDGTGDACNEVFLCGDVWPPESSPGAQDCGDGKVNLEDIMAEIDFALTGVTPDTCQFPRADVPTGTPPFCTPPDGVINVLDIMVIKDMTLAKQDCCNYYYHTIPPIISDIEAINITCTSATIVWTTNEPADSLVDCGLDTDYGLQISNEQLVISHSVTLTGLLPDTTYHYMVTSNDTAGDSAESGDNTFTTMPQNNMPVVIEAEEMSNHDNGAQQGEFWNLWANGTMSEELYFPDTDVYRFEVIAKGQLAGGTGPEMGLLIDGEIVEGTVFVNTDTPETFVFDTEVTAGIHTIATGFYNDFYNPSAGEDRNLYVDKTIITVSPVLDIIEAEEMSNHDNGAQVGGYWLLWANGVMSEDVYFPATDIYRFEIVAKGQLVDGIGPEMGLLIDGEIVEGTVFVNTDTPETFVFDAEIIAGSHTIAIGFYNDFYNPSAGEDRNLYVDKTTITISPVMDIIEAEEMSNHDNGAQVGDYWLLWANGVMSEEVDFPSTGVYQFEVIAKGQLAGGTGPEMGLLIDGEVINTIFVNTETPETFIFDAEITEGIHELTIDFYNDYWDPIAGEDRNLYVDKIILTGRG